ncbi:MAG: arginase family protein [Chloroflexota bacterium]|jgi:arginase family enzyme
MNPLLVGSPFDNAIQTMLRFKRGVTGAAAGPAAVLAAFEQQYQAQHPTLKAVTLPLHNYNLTLTSDNWYDLATVKEQQIKTEQAHAVVTDAIAGHCRNGFLPLTIGGDHSLTFPIIRGLKEAYPHRSLGLIYLDAHLDMRSLESFRGVRGLISNGNTFRRLVVDIKTRLNGRNIAILGLQRSSSSIFWQMANFAKSQQVTMIHQNELDLGAPLEKAANRAIVAATDGTEGVYLSIDIGVVDQTAAPGVSSPNPNGLSPDQLLTLVKIIANRVPIVGLDLVEVSSRQQYWGELWGEQPLETAASRQRKLQQTAELAARILHQFLQHA